MKIAILSLAIIFGTLIPHASQAQYNFPLSELQKLTTKNASDFETAMLEKDYTLQAKSSTKILKVYTSDKAGADGKKNTISRYQVPNAMAKVTFTTSDKKHYLDIKTHLAGSGLKFVKEETKVIDNTQAGCYDYANGALKVSLCTYIADDVTWYITEVHL